MTTLWQTAAEGGLVVFLLGIAWWIHRYHEQRTDTVFRRFDEHKHLMDKRMDEHKERMALMITEKFVDKEVCKLIHDTTKERFMLLERKMDDGFHNLDEKMKILLRHNGH